MKRDVIVSTDKWAVLYVQHGSDGKVYPEIHAVYETHQQAYAAVASKIDPTAYYVRRAYDGVFS